VDLGIAEKVALVTGASSGIGRGIARALGREGAMLAVTARRADRLRELRGEIEADGGPPPVVIEYDFLRDDAAGYVAAAAQ
jgi:short-subunit dehydrogenase